MDIRLAATSFPPFWKGVKKNHIAVQKKFILAAFDTETCYGQVFCTAFKTEGKTAIYHGIKKNHLTWLLDQVKQIPGQTHATTVLAAHYLTFDLSVLFWDALNPIEWDDEQIEIRKKHGLYNQKAPRTFHFSMLDPQCEIELFMGKPCFGRIKFFDHSTVHIIDTFAFFVTSLKKALKVVGSKTRKLKKPEMLGKRVIPMRELLPYVRADIDGVYDLLSHIIKTHQRYESRLCVSAPMLAGKIFRHYYMKRDFALPPMELIIDSMLSYHGGKNYPVARIGQVVPKAQWYKGCYDLDIRSAYPEAMRQLPDFENGKWIKGKGLRFLRRYPHGIYRAWGRVKSCKWGVLFTHDFKKITGDFKDTCLTGYEVLEALRAKELTLRRIEGWGFKQGRGSRSSAFKEFVDHFYEKKETATSEAERYWYKLILNSTYGKFVARHQDEDGNRIAGSMFDPSIGSLITGYVRAKIHRLEHKYDAIHTATDGLITQRKPDPADMGKALGCLKQENFGPCLIIRNKLYMHYDTEGKLKKCGLHGFQGTPEELEKMWKQGKRAYTVNHLVRFAEAWHVGIRPGTPIEKKPMLLRA